MTHLQIFEIIYNIQLKKLMNITQVTTILQRYNFIRLFQFSNVKNIVFKFYYIENCLTQHQTEKVLFYLQNAFPIAVITLLDSTACQSLGINISLSCDLTLICSIIFVFPIKIPFSSSDNNLCRRIIQMYKLLYNTDTCNLWTV